MKVTVSRWSEYRHRHGEVGPPSRHHTHTFRAHASVDRVGFAKPINVTDFDAAWGEALGPYIGLDLHEEPGMEPHLLALAFRFRDAMLKSYPDVMVRLVEDDLEVEVP